MYCLHTAITVLHENTSLYITSHVSTPVYSSLEFAITSIHITLHISNTRIKYVTPVYNR